MHSFSIVLEQVGLFAVYMTVGMTAVKAGVFNEEGLAFLSRLVTKIALPLLVFTNILNGCTREDLIASKIVLLLSVVLYLVLFILAKILKKIFRMEGDRGKVYEACILFGNCGFIGIPVITALFPERGILYIAVFTIVDMLVIWTYGVYLTAPEGSVKGPSLTGVLKKLVTPVLCATVLSLLCVFFAIPLPTFALNALTRVGSMATPLALIYLGGIFCYIRVMDFLKRKELYGMIAGKMILAPAALHALFRMFPGIRPDVSLTMSLLAGMPVMTIVTMLANSQGSDGNYAAGAIFFTTVASIATLPLVTFLIG